jgi:hypothetical protein
MSQATQVPRTRKFFHWLLTHIIIFALGAAATISVVATLHASWDTLPRYGTLATYIVLGFSGGTLALVLYAMFRGINQYMGKRKIESDLHVATVQIELQERQRYLVRDEDYSQIAPPLSSLPTDYNAGYSDVTKVKHERVLGTTKQSVTQQQVPRELAHNIIMLHNDGVSNNGIQRELHISGNDYWMISAAIKNQ